MYPLVYLARLFWLNPVHKYIVEAGTSFNRGLKCLFTTSPVTAEGKVVSYLLATC